MNQPALGLLGSAAVSIATAIVLLGLAVAVFLNPGWVAFEQGRAGAARLTGYTPDQLAGVSGAVLADLVLGPASFDQAVGGVAVFTERERAHLRDVRGVLGGFMLVVAVAVAIVIAAHRRARGGPSWWRAVERGAAGLAAGIVAAGIVAAVAFEPAFEVFHRLFFAGGTYTFDPRTERLVQLFPFRFWFETTLALGVVAVALAFLVAFIARRRSRDTGSAAQATGIPVEVAR